MKDYKQLAIRYLKMNRRRSLVTIWCGNCNYGSILYSESWLE